MADEWSITETETGGKEDFNYLDTEEEQDNILESVSWEKVVS